MGIRHDVDQAAREGYALTVASSCSRYNSTSLYVSLIRASWIYRKLEALTSNVGRLYASFQVELLYATSWLVARLARDRLSLNDMTAMLNPVGQEVT